MKQIMELWKDEYFKEKGVKYSNHVNKFIEYLIKIEKVDKPKGVTLSDVDDCIGWYAEIGKINYRSSMESHLESVKSYYDYLSETDKSSDIFSNINYENFKEELFSKHNLNEGKPRESFPMESVLEILTCLDDDLKMFYDGNPTDIKRKNLIRAILRIYIKITLIAPAKKNVICNIKFKDFNDFMSLDAFRWIIINGVKINIPNGLKRDIEQVVLFATQNQGNEPQGDMRLFDYIYGKKFSKGYINEWFYTFVKAHDIFDLQDAVNTYPIEPIMITAIQAMVNRMANPALIARICGVKIASIENKYYANREYVIKYEETLDQAINWEIAKNEYYTYI